jgi:lysine 2,3-aminomutase
MAKDSTFNFKEYYYPSVSESDWLDYRWQLSNRITNLDCLHNFLKIDVKDFTHLKKFEDGLNLSITPYYLSLINPEDEFDPIKLQCVPSPLEFQDDEGMEDPLGEESLMKVKNVIHKYPDRILLLVTNQCPVYCRHCFRRNKWGNSPETKMDIQSLIEYIKKNKEIKEVIISGGEPLLLPSFHLESILKELRKIDQIEVIRIASRVPVVLPQRIDEEILQILKKYSPIWFVTHFNHSEEITKLSAKGCSKLRENGITVLTQSVMLKGINDDSKTLEKLFRNLIKIGVKPYYLFQCDPAKGVKHFRTSVFKGIEIIKELNGKLSGIAVPKFAIDLQGGGKVNLEPDSIVAINEKSIVVKNFQGKIYEYKI